MQQLLKAGLARAQLLLLAQALGHILVQSDQSNAHPLAIQHGQDGGLVVVLRAIAAAVGEMPFPGPPGHQSGPHVVVRVCWRLAAGQHRRLAPTHLVQAVAGVALKLGVDPVDHALGIGHDHGQRAVFQGSAQHPQALQCGGHALAAREQGQQQKTRQSQQCKGRSAITQTVGGSQHLADVVEHHHRPGAGRVAPIQITLLYGVRQTVEQHLGGRGRKRQR